MIGSCIDLSETLIVKYNLQMWKQLLLTFPYLSFLSPVEIFTNLQITDCFRDAVQVLKGRCGVYCIINTNTGQIYIGSSNNIGQRISDHLASGSHSNVYLQNSIDNYGLENFIFIVIEFCEHTQLLIREQYY